MNRIGVTAVPRSVVALALLAVATVVAACGGRAAASRPESDLPPEHLRAKVTVAPVNGRPLAVRLVARVRGQLVGGSRVLMEGITWGDGSPGAAIGIGGCLTLPNRHDRTSPVHATARVTHTYPRPGHYGITMQLYGPDAVCGGYVLTVHASATVR